MSLDRRTKEPSSLIEWTLIDEMEMRPLVSWMTKVDDAILEWFESHEIAAPPKVIHTNLDVPVSYSQVKRRVRVLEENGLLDQDAEQSNYYAITTIGRWYLDGSIGPEKLEGLATDDSDPSSLLSGSSDGGLDG